MYIINGIAYAGEKKPFIKVTSVRPMDDYRLWLKFNTGEEKIFDFTPLLIVSLFEPLKDKHVFNSVYIDNGVPVWMDGEIDIAPEKLYLESIPSRNSDTN